MGLYRITVLFNQLSLELLLVFHKIFIIMYLPAWDFHRDGLVLIEKKLQPTTQKSQPYPLWLVTVAFIQIIKYFLPLSNYNYYLFSPIDFFAIITTGKSDFVRPVCLNISNLFVLLLYGMFTYIFLSFSVILINSSVAGTCFYVLEECNEFECHWVNFL